MDFLTGADILKRLLPLDFIQHAILRILRFGKHIEHKTTILDILGPNDTTYLDRLGRLPSLSGLDSEQTPGRG